MSKYKMTSLLMGLMMAFIFTVSTACAADIKFPPNTAALLFIGEDGKVVGVVDRKGEPVRPCVLPGEREEYKLPVCEPIPSVTADRGDSIAIFFNRQNPCYITIFIGGQQVKVPVPDQYCP